MKSRLTLAACLVLVAASSYAQLTVSPQTDLVQLARTITGPGVIISNPQVDCHHNGYGEFQYAGSLLGIDEGILLTSGTINNAVGPNNVQDKTFQAGTPGNALLNTVTGRTTHDACKFEFDVIPAGDSLRFDFVFASEEYNEWVASQYNDVFGFFISGPGIAGDPGIGSDKNIALVPGTDQAVTINNVNNGSNQAYYNDNTGGQHVQYDGFTRGLSAFSLVQPCATYHLKLIVADASDRKFDSGVFIAKVKSNPITMQLISANGGDSLIEGCNNGLIRFTRQNADDEPLNLAYYLQGTAINGTDYAAIGNTDPAVPKLITIPANQAFADQPIQLVADNAPESPESIWVILGNPNCPASNADTLVIPVVDSLNVSVSPAISTICPGGQVQLNATGGGQYAWSPATGLSATNIPDPVASPTATRTYTVAVSHGDCSGSAQATVRVSNMAPTAHITAPLCAGAANGAINLSVSGGIPPYSFLWIGPNGFSASTEDLAGIPAGTFTVTITDAACTKTQSFNVGQPAPLSVDLVPSLLVFGQNISCHGGMDGTIDATATGGTAPYSASWTGPGGFAAGSIDIGGLSAGAYAVTITDANGCTATNGITLTESAPMAAEITDTAHVACANDQGGAATVTVSGGMPNYSYSWNTVPAQTSATATGLAPGSYAVMATDQYGCTVSSSVTIQGPTAALGIQLSAQSHVTCHGAANGSATIAVSGGTPGYGITWNTTPEQAGATAAGLSGGTYTATVTDAHGCTASLQVTILEPAQALTLNVTGQQAPTCFSGQTGSITVLASGGSGPYSYSWNTVPVRHGATVNGLPAGSYTATATDIHGCTATQTVVLAGPAAALTASITMAEDVACAGTHGGSATVGAAGGTAPYSYHWNTTPAQTGATATGLGSGNWQVVVTDANLCSTSATAAIAEPATLLVDGTITPAQCQGTANGAVHVEVGGGTSPYIYSWTGPSGFTSSDEDLSGIGAGGYTLAVTDAHGCSTTRSFDVNQPGLFTVAATPSVYGNANVSCPASTDGSIDLHVSGAVPPYSFSWSGPGGFTSAQEDLSALAAGTYHVSISDANGCSTDHDLLLAAPAPIGAQLTPGMHGAGALSCFGGSDGSISSTITGGNAPYTVAWSGPNGFSSAQPQISGLVAGSYQAIISDANNCSAVQSITLSQPAALSAASGGSTPATCFGSNTGQATVQATGGTAPYTYAWATSPVQHAATATGLAAGTYTVQVTDANGCNVSTSISVGGPSAALTVGINSIGQVLCHGAQTGSATAAATGGSAPYTYVWNTVPQTQSASVSGLAAGTWTVTATDAAGCSVSKNVVISQPALPLAATLANVHHVACHGDHDGTASLLTTGGSGNYTIVWNSTPVQTGSTATGLAPGNYTATISDANGCPQPVVVPFTINSPAEPLAISFQPFTYPGGAQVSCPGSSDGSIDVTVTGGTPTYFFHWQDGNGNIFQGEDPSGLAAGSYLLNVTDGHGCYTDALITLLAPMPLAATADVQPAMCHGESNGAIHLEVAGGASPYTYLWNGPDAFTASSADLNMLAAGVYTATVSDANGCTLAQPFDVSEPGTFSFTATSGQVSCSNSNDGSIQLTADGGTLPYQYAWSGPNGFTANTADITGLAAGSYHLTLTDGNGCSALYSTTLAPPPPLTAFAISIKSHGGYDLSCAGAADGHIITNFFGGTAPYTFSWTGPGGFTANTADIDLLVAGTYSLTVTDAHGCTVHNSLTLVAPPALTATAVAQAYAGGAGVSCPGTADGSITLTPGGGTAPYSVSWSGPGGFASGSWQITGLAAGTYTATVTDANGCTATKAATLTAPAPLTLASTGTDLICHDSASGAVDLVVSGGSTPYTYQWTGPGIFAASTEDLAAAGAGTYTVMVADANGCTATGTITLEQPAAIAPTADITTTACQGANTGAVDLEVSGGTGSYTYAWTGFPAFSASTQDINGLFAGAYTVVITDAAGCSATAMYNVGEPGLFLITAELGGMPGGYQVSCADAADGSIDATVGGGTGPYSYAWTGPGGFSAISQDLANVPAGEYHLTVHDALGCNATQSFTLVAPSPILVGLVATAQPTCDGGQNGSIGSAITGGIAPYSVSWSGPGGALGISANLSGVGAGTYTATVTDALGCTASANIALTGPAGIEAVATATLLANGHHVSCADASDGSIGLQVNGGTAPYQVSWSGPGGFQSASKDITNLAAGTYTAMITDANGCSFATQVQLTAPAPLTSVITTSSFSSGHAISCAGAGDGAIQLTISGGSPGYIATWSGPNGFNAQQTALQNLLPGTYHVTILDAAGCATYNTAILTAPLPITASAVLSDISGYGTDCTGQGGSIDLTAAGGLAPYQYSWSGPGGFASTGQDLQGLAAGTYQVVITDANTCSTMRSFTLTAPPLLQAALAITSNPCDASNDASINLTVSGGAAPFTFAWTGPNGFTAADEDLSGLESGDYAVTVTAGNGCSTTAQGTVMAAAPMVLDLYASQYGAVNISCFGESTGNLELSVVGGHAPITIAWSGPDGFLANTGHINGLAAGLYSATITDGQGCVRDTSFTLIQPDSPLTVTINPTDVACHGGTDGTLSTLVSGGGAPYAFTWRGPDSTQYSTQDLTGLIAGTYELVLVDAHQCVHTEQVSIAQPDSALSATFNLATYNGFNTSCATAADGAIGAAVRGGSPGYTFSWSGPGGFTSAQDSISGAAAGDYHFTATDTHGCSVDSIITLVPAPPVEVELVAATFPGGITISCAGANDGAIQAEVSGGTGSLSLQWTGPNGFSSTETAIDSLPPGTYCLTATDPNGCGTQQCHTIAEPELLAATAAATDAPCGLETGAVEVEVTGGSAPYSFTWNTGAQTEDLTGIIAGAYSVSITDANGCTAGTGATVEGSPAVEAEATVTTPLCHDDANGAVDLAITSGTAPFTYLWNNGSTDGQIAGLQGGSYAVTITDGNGCTWQQLIAVQPPAALAADTVISHYANGHNVSTWNGTDGSIALNVQGGTAPYAYAWNDGTTAAQRTGLSAGTYGVEVTDANGCTLAVIIILTQPSEIDMPSGFTPNGDGQNDHFVVHGIEGFPDNQLTVFNRWGNVVYDQLHYSNQWAGENQQGKSLPEGTYFVVLRLNADRTLQHYVDLRR